MAASQGRGGLSSSQRWPAQTEEKLDRGLVAGLLLEVLLDPSPPLRDPEASRGLVKTRLKHTLACHLAGLVTLDRFRALMGSLEPWFALYYPLLSRLTGPAAPSGTGERELQSAAPPGCTAPALREELLKDWCGHHPGLLPSRPHRKLTWEKLKQFLAATRGRWFGVKDFARHFDLDRKTAWEYLQKLRQAELLQHNRGRSAAARYCLADRFLRVRTQALRQQVALELSDWPQALSAALADALLATGGDAFWEGEWRPGPFPLSPRLLLDRLEAGEILQQVAASGPARLLRLHPRWRREDEGASARGCPT